MTQPAPPAVTLWHRPTRRHRWRVYATGQTRAEVLALMRGKGEWTLTEGDADPSGKPRTKAQTGALS